MTTTEQLAQALRECAEAAWHKDSHRVYFDSTVAFHPHYNFCGLDGIQREEFLGEHDCIVWPCGSGRKWSAYCTYQGRMWIERFDTVEEAKAVCMELLAKVSPNDPFVKACALLAAHEAEKAQAAGGVDCIGLALELESRAGLVESQTTERAMRAAAHGLRLLAGGADPAAPVAGLIFTDEMRADLIRDTAEVFDRNGPFTPQIVRDVIEYVDSALQVLIGKAHGKAKAAPAEPVAAPQGEPVAARYDFDGYGYQYIDNGHGSDWETRIPDAEMLYTKSDEAEIRADERERCAKLCEAISDEYQKREGMKWPELKTDAQEGAQTCAHRIRERGQE